MSPSLNYFIRTIPVWLGICCATTLATAEITLPDPLAIEIPVAGQTMINANASPLRELLESATSPLEAVTHDRQDFDFPLGPTLVEWTDGTEVKSAYVYVYPSGQTPVGSTAYERGTAGTGGTNVVRDKHGEIHVAWLDSGRGSDRVMYRRGTQNPVSGAITWDTAALRVSEDANDTWNSMVAVAVSDNYVHFVWYGGSNNTYYRRLRVSDYGFEPIRGTTAVGSLSNDGPDVSVRNDDEIHVVTPANGTFGGQYAVSLNAGIDWTVEDIPYPGGGLYIKVPAVAADQHGNAHVVFPWLVRNSPTRYWELRYVRRRADGTWEDGHYVMNQFPEWRDPWSDGDPGNDGWDMVSGSLDIAVDDNDDIHVTWHGSVTTHVFGEDEAFYIRRPAISPGVWPVSWEPYVSLWPVANGFSFAPSISVDSESRIAIPVVFHDTSTNEEYDSNFRLMRDGAWDGRPALSLTTMAEDGFGLKTWFPCAAPEFYKHSNGRVWLGTLATDWPAESSADMIIVHQRRELTSLLRQTPVIYSEPGAWSWTGLVDATGYDVLRGDLGLLRSTGGDFTAATSDCLIEDHPSTSLGFGGDPPAGEGVWFLVRGVDETGGLTYESLEPSQVGSRDAEIALAPGACL